MRIFFYDTDKKKDNLSLLFDTDQVSYLTPPSRPLNFPAEIVQKIVDYLPRSALPTLASINRTWYSIAMMQLYKHIYIRTLPHWLCFVRTMSNASFSAHFGPCIQSLVLKPSPRLVPSQLTSALNQKAIENDDKIQPYLRGYVRLERVDYNLTGLEFIDMPMEEQTPQHENYTELDTTEKEAEWLLYVTDSQLATVLTCASQIAYLDVSGCENLSQRVLTTIAAAKKNPHDHPKPMAGLWMTLLRECEPEGFLELIQAEKRAGLERKLRHLDIGFHGRMTDETIRAITSYWGPSLTHVRLNSISGLTDLSVLSIARSCPNLRLLHLTRCWQIRNPALQQLAQNCPKLSYLSISFLSHVNEYGIKHLVTLCPELVWLDITGCSINSLFKQMIIDGWKTLRIQQRLPPIHFQDVSMNLL